MSTQDDLLTPSQAASRLQSLLSDVNEALAPHDNIKAGDPQYEDPQEWWLRPLQTQLKEALAELKRNQ